MSRDPIDRALRDLPRVGAGAGFTARVLDRAGERRPRRRPPYWLAAAAGAALLAALAVTLPRGTVPEPHLEAEVERLRHEHTRLLEDLDRLDELTVRSFPLVVVDTPDGLVVLDLGEAALAPWPEEGPRLEETILARSTL